MNDADRQALGLALAIAGLLGLLTLFGMAYSELCRQQERAETAVLRADVAAWQIGQLLQEARDITGQAAREQKELPRDPG